MMLEDPVLFWVFKDNDLNHPKAGPEETAPATLTLTVVGDWGFMGKQLQCTPYVQEEPPGVSMAPNSLGWGRRPLLHGKPAAGWALALSLCA